MKAPVLAVDIGGTKTAAGVVSVGRVEHVHTVPTPAAAGPVAILDAAWRVAQEAMRGQLDGGGAHPDRLGIASAGVIDPVAGVVSAATGSLAGWAGARVVDELGERSGLPARALNDVHAHGLGEAVHGHGQGLASMVLVAVGTGIGGAHVLDRRVVLGAHHVAGHLGHLPCPEAEGMPCDCGRSGHLEAVASGVGLARHFADLLGADAPHTPLTGREVLQAADDDAHPHARLAREVTTRAGRALGRVIGGLLNTLDPDVVVLTGGVAAAGPVWHEAVREGVAHDAMDLVAGTPILPAVAPHGALLGAALWAENLEGA